MSVQAASYEAIAKGSKSFAAASKLLEPAVRDDVVKLYAWCRHCDDVIDGQTLGGELTDLTQAEQRERLEDLKAETARALDTSEPVSPPFRALRDVATKHDFPRGWAFDLLEGFRMDVERTAFRTLADTLLYSYHVAGIVGVMMARVMGARDDAVLDRACDLGLAFQLTNIARDIEEDARAGRSYVPAEWDMDTLAAAKRLVAEAEPYYASALRGLPALSFRSAWAIAAARRIYRAIGLKLNAMERWEGRAFTTKSEKFMMVLAAWGDARRSRRSAEATPRPALWTRPA